MNQSQGFYLDFERPIAELEKKIEEIRTYASSEGMDMSEEVRRMEERLRKLEKEIYSSLTRWQRVQVARHPKRPYTLDYIQMTMTDFVELHGDRLFGDDHAVVGGLARLNGDPVVVIGHQKGRNTKESLYRNFGMAHPEGYRKALRLMKMAAKFRRPVVCLIDTPGAYPGVGAEERGQAESIARNLFEMSHLPTPIVVAIIGEGASGGALGIGVGDRLLMMENAWYSVINPEGCSLILWRNRDQKEDAAEALKLTAADLLELGIVDRIVPEPFGGAHRDSTRAGENLKAAMADTLLELRAFPVEKLVEQRVEKFCRMGVWEE
ncbi:MAG: acetyl-CoA carboxylase carboxyltransferase subunit alpha [Candidatus Handelsmanbacteria bacterium RIFCSPLOWO2_12_FULL_64_10]|uniref:Acetyl-coenzyme A carboxylase carboxyl transferase subunit alpha n=1 Tax=Handelsmanbacteria sp. (strain RIFCSPLOWO2_12_FULL_64_10) TaxID=1817868 RepID=A0A1F6D358_HANXR|nr:MAG: acetyl-CoA carboxylase carboxyltransferase subunit alpha [Candidatus Handelsmanbacteria bacterium RIFCSPLOWO2_12_FULL_64_10]